MTIVGIVGDVKQGPLSSVTRPEVYEPVLQMSDVQPEQGDAYFGPRTFATIVRASQASDRDTNTANGTNGVNDPAVANDANDTAKANGTTGANASGDGDAASRAQALIRGLQQAVRQIDPALPLSEARTLDTMVRSSATTERFATRLLGTFALTAVLLAALGLYGLLSSVVTQRTREIGVRVALGASSGDVVGLIVRQGLTLVGVGLAIGLACALAATQTMKGMLFGVQPFDPVTFGAVAATLAGVGVLASLVPAWRAARVDPVRALRGD
jgi:ABC-type antimicrobial peptide transport system permease subunit